MKFLFLFYLLFCYQSSFCQANELNGIVINGEDNSKLVAASIFINNSSRGTLSDANGAFTLRGITEKTFDLIISYTGFTTVSLKITPGNIGHFQTIKMVPRKQTMEDISIMIPEKEGWKKWGKFFTDAFLGESDFAKNCSIENPKALHFFYDKKQNRLIAYSNDNLIIRNKALGYLIKYQLEEFSYDYSNKIVTYVGYTNFEDLNRSAREKGRWVRARKEAYSGSLMHFMRAVYSNSVAGQGFEVREMIRVYNDDTLFRKFYLPGNMPEVIDGDDHYTAIAGKIPYFKKIPDYVDLLNQHIFSFENAVQFDSSSLQKEFYFDQFLQVIYKNGYLNKDYLLANGLSPFLKSNQISDVRLLGKEPLIIEKDGSYFNPLHVMTSGYWGWCKLAEMLPTDYETAD